MGNTMKLHNISLLYALLVFSISMPKFHLTEASSFSVDLIHRDSLQSPTLDSTSRQVITSLQRSFNRAKSFAQDPSQQTPSTDILADKGEYLLRFSMGTPPVETLAIADTGSDLLWIQCDPCQSCFQQKAPFFAPDRSSSYQSVSCSSDTCTSQGTSGCDSSKDACTYTMTYGDRSYSRGELATETITLGSSSSGNVSINNIVIGCGHNDQGTFSGGASGIVGLGGGQVSLISQLGDSIQGKFSYCLLPLGSTSPSKMNFGDQAVVSGAGVVETPLVSKSPVTYYYLTLEGMSVGAERFNPRLQSLDSGDLAASMDGNIIIDSGTTLTFLPQDLYTEVESAIKKQMSLEATTDPQGLLKVCYVTTGNDVQVPEVTAHFRGADVKLNALNVFVKTGDSTLCLAFVPATSIPIYGNLAQMNFLVGYDLEKKTVSFKPTDCSQQG